MTQTMAAPTDIDTVNARFLDILPNLKRFARKHLRHHRSLPREEAIAEVLALGLIACHSLLRRHRAEHIDSAGFAHHLVRSVRHGRTAASGQQGRDALSPLGRLRHGRMVRSLDARVASQFNDGDGSLLGELVPDRDRPVPDQVAFRVDFGEWLNRQSPRDREMMALLAAGERPGDVARKLGFTQAVVSQRREKWRKSWGTFIEPAEAVGGQVERPSFRRTTRRAARPEPSTAMPTA